jgi:hypothetical protein
MVGPPLVPRRHPQIYSFYRHLVAGAALLVRGVNGVATYMSTDSLIDPQAFDWFLTIEAEIKHVWNVPWNLGRIIFFGTRYLVLIDTTLSLYRGSYLSSRPIMRSEINFR